MATSRFASKWLGPIGVIGTRGLDLPSADLPSADLRAFEVDRDTEDLLLAALNSTGGQVEAVRNFHQVDVHGGKKPTLREYINEHRECPWLG